MAATFYGDCALLICAGRKSMSSRVAALACLGMIGAIAASRVLLHTHTLEEVIVGLAIGLSLTAMFAPLTATARAIDSRVLAAALSGCDGSHGADRRHVECGTAFSRAGRLALGDDTGLCDILRSAARFHKAANNEAGRASSHFA